LLVEDGFNGVRSTFAAGQKVIVTPSSYTEGKDFAGAARVMPDLTYSRGPL